MIATQRAQLEVQLKDVENAIKELESLEEGSDVYKAIGNILIKTEKDKIYNELKEKKETLEIRINTLKRQEEKLLEKLKEMQAKLQDSLKRLQQTSG